MLDTESPYFNLEHRQIAYMVWENAVDSAKLSAYVKIAKTPNVVVLGTEYSRRGQSIKKLQLFAFPRPQHYSVFEQSHKTLRPGGPSSHAVSSVGSVFFDFKPTEAQNYLDFDLAQGHYKIGKENGYIPKKLALQYEKWRIECLRVAFQIAKERKAQIRFFKNNESLQPRRGEKSPFHKEIIAVADEYGAKLKEQNHALFVEF